MSTSIGDIVQRIRWATNTENNTVVTDQELATKANDSFGALDDILIGLYEDYKLTNTQKTITTSADGSNNFTLPTDFLKARLVERQWGSDWVRLEPFSLQQHSAISSPTLIRAGAGWTGYYRIEGNTCEVLPWQNAAAVYRIWYVPSFTPITFSVDGAGKFTTSTATLPVHMDVQAWHAFVIADVSAHVQQKQELDGGPFIQEREMQRQRVIGAAKTRDAGRAKRVADTRGGGFSLRRRWN